MADESYAPVERKALRWAPLEECSEGHVTPANPRLSRCLRCNEELQPDGARRDSAYEERFLKEVAEYVERGFGFPVPAFGAAVRKRLAVGDERYGNSWVGKNLKREILEEAWDAAAYALLEAQKELHEGFDAVEVHHLFEIACHAAAIDHHVRQLGFSQFIE